MDSNLANIFKRYHYQCPISVLVSGDQATPLGDRLLKNVLPNYHGPSIYQSNDKKGQRQSSSVVVNPKRPRLDQNQVNGKHMDWLYRHRQYVQKTVVTAKQNRIANTKSYWRILSVMEHDSVSNNCKVISDNRVPVKIAFCLFRARKVMTLEKVLVMLMPVLVVEMTREELYATSIHYVDDLVRRQMVCVNESIMLMADGFDFFLTPEKCKWMTKLLTKDHDEKRTLPDLCRSIYYEIVHKLDHIVVDKGPKAQLCEIFSNSVDIVSAAILFKQYAFAMGQTFTDLDHIKFSVYRLQTYKDQIDTDWWHLCDGGMAPLNSRVSIPEATELMLRPELNGPLFYKKFWSFCQFTHWCINWRHIMFITKQLCLTENVQKVAWLHFKAKDVINDMLEITELNNFFDETVVPSWVSTECTCRLSDVYFCNKCKSSVEGLAAYFKKKMDHCANEYDYLSYFRDTLKAHATSDPLMVAQQKLNSYNPIIIDWAPNEFGGYLNKAPGANQPDKFLRALTRANATVLNKRHEYAKLVQKWACTDRNVRNVDRPTESTYSNLVQEMTHNSTVITPIIAKPIYNGFGLIITEKRHWTSTLEYQKQVCHFAKEFDMQIGDNEDLDIRLNFAKELSLKTKQTANELDILSYIYDDLIYQCTEKVGSTKLAHTITQEMAGSFHLKLDKKLPVHSIIVDVDLANSTKKTCITNREKMVIARAYWRAISRVLCINRMIEAKQRIDVDHYLCHSKDVKNMRLYTYWSESPNLPEGNEIHMMKKVAIATDGTVRLDNENCLGNNHSQNQYNISSNDNDSDVIDIDPYYEDIDPYYDDYQDCDEKEYEENPPDNTTFQISEGQQLSKKDILNQVVVAYLNSKPPTKSMRICIELPPNVSFVNLKAFKTYIPMILAFLKNTEVNDIACRVAKNGDINEMFDKRIYDNCQVRLPHSGKKDGSEPFKFIFVMPTLAHASDRNKLSKMCLHGCFDKTMGLVHADRYPSAISENELEEGMVIGGCNVNIAISWWTTGSSSNFTRGEISSRMDIAKHTAYMGKVQEHIIKECLKCTNGNVITLEDALNNVVKPAMLDAIKQGVGGEKKLLIRPNDFRDIKRRPVSETLNILRHCYLTPKQENDGCQAGNWLQLYVSRSKADARSAKSAGKFPSCVFYNHDGSGGCMVALFASLGIPGKTGVTFMLKYKCFKPRCAGHIANGTITTWNTLLSFQLVARSITDTNHDPSHTEPVPSW